MFYLLPFNQASTFGMPTIIESQGSVTLILIQSQVSTGMILDLIFRLEQVKEPYKFGMLKNRPKYLIWQDILKE
jgi:hypothetical protein